MTLEYIENSSKTSNNLKFYAIAPWLLIELQWQTFLKKRGVVKLHDEINHASCGKKLVAVSAIYFHFYSKPFSQPS